jgi:hypothetical protein
VAGFLYGLEDRLHSFGVFLGDAEWPNVRVDSSAKDGTGLEGGSTGPATMLLAPCGGWISEGNDTLSCSSKEGHRWRSDVIGGEMGEIGPGHLRMCHIAGDRSLG